MNLPENIRALREKRREELTASARPERGILRVICGPAYLISVPEYRDSRRYSRYIQFQPELPQSGLAEKNVRLPGHKYQQVNDSKIAGTRFQDEQIQLCVVGKYA